MNVIKTDKYIMFEIDDKGTFKETEHDVYKKNILYTRPAQVKRSSLSIQVNSTLFIHPKRWYAYDGVNGTLNVVISD
jgi:NADPH-dependent 7-cyano-7-deazaguanine reductase QueF-like protein